MFVDVQTSRNLLILAAESFLREVQIDTIENILKSDCGSHHWIIRLL